MCQKAKNKSEELKGVSSRLDTSGPGHRGPPLALPSLLPPSLTLVSALLTELASALLHLSPPLGCNMNVRRGGKDKFPPGEAAARHSS